MIRWFAGWGPLAALLLGAGVAPLAAQSLDQALAPDAARHSVVRLRLQGARLTGRLMALGGGAARLETASGERSIALGQVDSAWARQRSTRTGAIVGAITGGVGTAIFVGLLASGLCESDCENIGLEGGAVGFGIGAVGGALVGAAIGAAIPRWRLRFPL
ncbi:MAG TPA: hypothetical protein VGA78_14925 [Gemmatimonadales bacterium]